MTQLPAASNLTTTHGGPAVVITGCGLTTALGLDVATTWGRLCAGQSGLGPLNDLEQRPAEPKTGGQAPPLPMELGESVSPPMAREVRYLRHVLRAALRQAGLAIAGGGSGQGDGKGNGNNDVHGAATPVWPYPAPRCGLILGTTLHGMRAGGRFFRENSVEPLRQFQAAAVLEGVVQGWPIGGAGWTTCAACSSGLTTVATAVTLLQSGELDLVIAGGYDPISEYAYAGFHSLRLVADEPPRPFGLNRPGMKLGEGYGVLVLERATDAAQRGATALAQVRGYGESADAHHLTQPHPQGRGAVQAITQALSDAGLSGDTIDMVTAHATGTPDNDRSEAAALERVFAERLSQIPIVACKSWMGHTLGGAGTVELILALCALRDQRIPPTNNVDADRLEFPKLRFARGRAEPAQVRATMNLSIGFGGANTCVILGPPEAASAMSAAPAAPLQVTQPTIAITSGGPAPRRVVITGMGLLLPGVGDAAGLEQWARAERAAPMTQTPGGIDDSVTSDLIRSPRVRRMSECAKLACAAARLACRDAGLDAAGAFGPGDAVVAASTHGSAAYCADYYRQIVEQGIEAANPMLFAEGVPNAAAAHLSLMLGLTGPSQTIIGSRTVALEALHLAVTRITQGRWTRALVCAAEEATDLIRIAYRHCGLHTRGEQGGAAFDEAGGFVMGPGSAALIVEEESVARARQARVLGVMEATATRLAEGMAEGQATPRTMVHAWGDLWRELGRPTKVITCANSTWLGKVATLALAESTMAPAASTAVPDVTVTSLYGHMAETFSVTPLAALMYGLRGGRLPRLLGDMSGQLAPGPSRMRPAQGTEPADQFACLQADYNGSLAGVVVSAAGAVG